MEHRRHGYYSAQSRELRGLAWVQLRIADRARAKLAVMNRLAEDDARRAEIAERQALRCMDRSGETACPRSPPENPIEQSQSSGILRGLW